MLEMTQIPKVSLSLNSCPMGYFYKKIIPTFQIPWVHRDKWNDKESYYSIEGKFANKI